ncbi:MAG TPA: AAA family ATPase [Candidatus Dormibacteraeota bacterium]|nr:AAA family ATPase [Candidatus Dormibacteraeota bacterium]
MTNNLVLNSLTKHELEKYLLTPTQPLLLVGAQGSGKSYLANELAAQLVKKTTDQLKHYPYLTVAQPDAQQTIGIDAIRQLKHFLSLRTPTEGIITRLVIIKDAHKMTTEAQNALLKILEEPTKGSIVIMTASTQQTLLPTIRSRVMIIALRRPSNQQLEKHFLDKGQPPDKIRLALAISNRSIGLATSLLDSDSVHPLAKATELARLILSKEPYERLNFVEDIAKEPDLIEDLCTILGQMAQLGLLKATDTTFLRWYRVLTSSYEARRQLLANAQPKLLLTSLMLGI